MAICSACSPEVFAVLVESEGAMVFFCGVELLEFNSPPPGNFLLGTFCVTSSDTGS